MANHFPVLAIAIVSTALAACGQTPTSAPQAFRPTAVSQVSQRPAMPVAGSDREATGAAVIGRATSAVGNVASAAGDVARQTAEAAKGAVSDTAQAAGTAAQGAANVAKETAQKAAKVVTSTGGVAGGVLGGAIGSIFGPIGTIAGASLGAWYGHAVEQRMGHQQEASGQSNESDQAEANQD
jgi:hypothetical protein